MSVSHPKVRIAVLVSGSGSNLEALLTASEKGDLPDADIVLVVSSRPAVLALERAQNRGIETVVVDPKAFSADTLFHEALLKTLLKHRIDLVCLAGYLRKLSVSIIQHFRGRILNIHPALLPKYGGAGMYGHFVHEAVLRAHEKESGCTVHLVDEEFDRGPILAQAKVAVLPNDTPEQLAARVLEQEHRLYPSTLKLFCEKLRGTL